MPVWTETGPLGLSSRAGMVWREAVPLALVAVWLLVLFFGWLQYSYRNQRVVVRWQSSLAESERARLERGFGLIDREGTSEGTWSYRLSDHSESNLRTLIESRFVAGTSHIHRGRFRVELDQPSWPGWMVTLAESERLVSAKLFVAVVALIGTWPYRHRLFSTSDRPPLLVARLGAVTLDAGFALLIVINGVAILLRDYVVDPPRLDSWPVTEMLINYAGGPVRRGLLGEAIRISNARGYHVDIYLLIFCISMAAWLLPSALLWRQSRRADLITRVVLLFSPVLLAFPLNDVDGFGRKDSLSLIYVSCGLLTLSMKDRPGRAAFVGLAAAGLPALVATHEAAVFFCLPSTILFGLVHLTRRETPSIGVVMTHLCTLLAPTLGVLTFVATHPGDREQAIKICLAAAQQYPGLTCERPPHAMASLIPETQALYAPGIREAWHSPALYWSLAGTLAYLSCLFLAARTALNRTGARKATGRAGAAFAAGAFVLLPTIPLYVVATDYGRWLSVASVIAVLILTNRHVMIPATAWIRAASSRVVRRSSSSSSVESDARGIVRAGGAIVTERLMMLMAALLTPFLFLPHNPPSFVLLRMPSGRTFGLVDFTNFVSALLAP